MRDARTPEPVVEALGNRKAHAGHWSTAVVLYLHADPRGQCNPSESTIAKLAGCTERTVKRAIRDLEDWGIVRVVRSSGIANTYHLATRDVLDTGDTGIPGQDRSPGTPVTPCRDIGVPGPVTPGSPKQEELEQSLNSGDAWERFWSSYPRHRDSERARAAFEARVAEGVDPEDLVSAAGAYAAECRRDDREERFIKLAHNFLDGALRPYEDYVDRHSVPPEDCPVCGGLGWIDDGGDGPIQEWCPRCAGRVEPVGEVCR